MERSGDREALRRHLTSARTLLLEHPAPRERAVVRAYQRMLEARRASVYREGAAREPERGAGDEPTVADWMAAVVPAAAPSRARRGRRRARRQARPNPPRRSIPRPDARPRRGSGPREPCADLLALMGIWVALIGMFLATWQFLSAGRAWRVSRPAGADA